MADTQSGTTIPRTQLLSFSRDPSRYTGDEGKKSEEEEPVDSQKPILPLTVARSGVLSTHKQQKATLTILLFQPSKNNTFDSLKSISSIKDD